MSSLNGAADHASSEQVPAVDDDSSDFSGKNPLATDDAKIYIASEPKVPKAVAMTGWNRTVGVDENYVPSPVHVRLGEPGTGLASVAVPPGRKPLAQSSFKVKSSLTDQTRSQSHHISGSHSWSDVRVTEADLKAAAALRKLEPAPGAAPLPSPRPWSDSDASSPPPSPPNSGHKYRQNPGAGTPSSSASSDLNFLVATGPIGGGHFGTRPSVGRSVEPRIPATVGEERLHNSLAKFFGHEKTQDSDTRDAKEEVKVPSDLVAPQEPPADRFTATEMPLETFGTRAEAVEDEYKIEHIGNGAGGADSAREQRIKLFENTGPTDFVQEERKIIHRDGRVEERLRPNGTNTSDQNTGTVRGSARASNWCSCLRPWSRRVPAESRDDQGERSWGVAMELEELERRSSRQRSRDSKSIQFEDDPGG